MCPICKNSFTSAQLEELVCLDCSDCAEVEALPENMPNLRFLAIYDTNIRRIPAYPGLEALYCFRCPVVELPDMPKLRKLVANGTAIDRLSEDYYRLEMANIDDTNVTAIPDSLISLRWLSANNTGLETISRRLISLEWLSIENTRLTEMPEHMPSLQYLNCSGTGVTAVVEDDYPMLRKITCRGCPINPFDFSNRIDVIS